MGTAAKAASKREGRRFLVWNLGEEEKTGAKKETEGDRLQSGIWRRKLVSWVGADFGVDGWKQPR